MMVCGCAIGVQFARNGTPCVGSTSDGARLRITLGTPVDPLLQIPLAVGDTAAGSGLSGLGRRRVPRGPSGSVRRRRPRGRSPRAPGLAPIRADPSASESGTAPIFQQPSVASTRCSELGIASATSEPDLCAGGSQGPSPLIGAGVEFPEGHRLRGAVERDDGHGRVVAPLFGELPKFGAERDSVVERVGTAVAPAPRSSVVGVAHADTGPLNSVSSEPSRTSDIRRSASTSVPSGNRISGWVCRSSTLTSDSSQKPRAPSS